MNIQDEMQNNDYIKRRIVYDRSDSMNAIKGLYLQIHDQYGGCIRRWSDYLFQIMIRSQAKLL